MSPIDRPQVSEYGDFYAAYVDEVPEGDVLELLAQQGKELVELLSSLDDEQARFRYAEGKWSIKQIAGHLADAERIFVCRAVCFARGETASLPGFDENQYVAAAAFDRRSLASLGTELEHLRGSTIAFFEELSADELIRSGVANGVSCSVRASAFLIAGHERHHLRVLRERYLPSVTS